MREYSAENRDGLLIVPRRVCLSYNFCLLPEEEEEEGSTRPWVPGVRGRGRRRRKTPFTEPVWRAGSSALSNIRIISMLEIFINGLCGTFNAPIGIAFPARTLVRRVLV